MKWNKFLIAGIAALILGISTASCTLMQDLFDDKVVTTIDNVKPEDRANAVPADLGLLPKETRDQLGDKEVVLVDKDSIIEPEKSVDFDDPDAGDFVSLGLGVANALWPGVAALEGLGVLFSQRKRRHYRDAAAKALPVNGKVELKDAIVALGRAVGVAHSSEKSKEAFEEDVKKTKVA